MLHQVLPRNIRSNPYWILFLGLLAVYFTLVYRAATEPLTDDEAYLYYRYIQNHPWYEIFTAHFVSSNHVLQSLLAYWSVRIFGVSEIALRLPSLIAAGFYLLAACLIAFLGFGRTALAILAIGLVTLNPLLLDHLLLARGYGIALAFFAWSLYFRLRYSRNATPSTLIGAGALLGLSISANLTFTIPCTALALMSLLRLRLPLAVRYIGSALLCAAIVLAIPLRTVRMADFYFGQPSLKSSITELSLMSLFYSGRLTAFPQWNEQYVGALRSASSWVVALVLLGIGCTFAFRFRSSTLLWFAGGSLLTSTIILVTAHYAIGLLYPYDRTGLYLLFLFPLAFLVAADALLDRTRAMWLPIALGAVILVIYCCEFHTGYFAEWRFTADFKRYLQTINSLSAGKTVRIGGSSPFWYLTAFYHDARQCNCVATIDEDSRKPGYDYYVLLPEDREYVQRLNLRVLRETNDSLLATYR